MEEEDGEKVVGTARPVVDSIKYLPLSSRLPTSDRNMNVLQCLPRRRN